MKSNNSKQKVKELTLHKPTASVAAVKYDWVTNMAEIELHFREENANFVHSRSWEMNTNGKEVTSDQVLDFLQVQLPDFDFSEGNFNRE